MSEHVKGSRLGRMARLAGVAARTGKDLALAKVRERLVEGESGAAEALQPTAARLVEVLG